MNESLPIGWCFRLRDAGFPQDNKNKGYCWSNTHGSNGWIYYIQQNEDFGWGGELWITAPSRKQILDEIDVIGKRDFDSYSLSIESKSRNFSWFPWSATLKVNKGGKSMSIEGEGSNELRAVAFLWLHLKEFNYGNYLQQCSDIKK